MIDRKSEDHRRVLSMLKSAGIAGQTLEVILRTQTVEDLRGELRDIDGKGRQFTDIIKEVNRTLDLSGDIGRLLYGNRYALAVLSATYPQPDLPVPLSRMISPMNEKGSHSIDVLGPYLSLCSKSERRLEDCMRDGNGLVVVEKGLLAKLLGRTAALCFESFTTSSGTFVGGNWYSPIGSTMTGVREAFIGGTGHINLAQGEWELMRVAYDSPYGMHADLIPKAKTAALNLPRKLPGTQAERFIYFRDHRE